MKSKEELFHLLMMEHFMNNQSSEVRYDILKREIRDVGKTECIADQLWAT